VRLLHISATVIVVLFGALAYIAALAAGPGVPRVVLQSVGGFLLGTVLVSYVYQYFIAKEAEDRFIAKLDDVLAHRVDAIFPAAARHGFTGFASEGVARHIFDDLGVGDELLWLDTYSPDIALFSGQLRTAVRSGAHVRMLVLDPTADTARMRAEEITEPGYSPERFSTETQAFIDDLEDAMADLRDTPGKLEVRSYRSLPCVPMYLVLQDGQITTGTTGFFLTSPSFNAVHICWTAVAAGMLGGFHAYFEHKWDEARVADTESAAASASVLRHRPT
jgi:hypothetical protein